jgi:DNA-binding NarL/FixJ family response regulator
MIRLLICDDHAVVRRGFRQILGDAPDFDVAAEAADGPEALRHVRAGGIDVALLDIALPGRDGLDVLKQARAEFPRLAVLMVSTYPEKQYALRCLRLGAAGYLNKSADPAELVAAIRQAAQGRLYVSAAVADTLASAMRKDAGDAPHERLSRREYQVFTLIAEGRSLGQIAAALSLSPNTVSTYRARIMEKIDTHNDVETALYAVRHRLVSAAVA